MHLSLYPLQIGTPDRTLHQHKGHLRHPLFLHEDPEFLFEWGGDDRDCGDAFLFGIELVNYEPRSTMSSVGVGLGGNHQRWFLKGNIPGFLSALRETAR